MRSQRLLVFTILRRLQVKGAWLAAGIFALHPVQVESVAWISELKNTLSGVFFFLSILAYLGFDWNRRRKAYGASLAFFILGLLSKTAISPMPAALLALLWWKRGRLHWKRDIIPLFPFFAAGIGLGLFTAWIEQTVIINGESASSNLAPIERVLVAGRAIWFYLGKLIAPIDLTFIYPRWEVSRAVWQHYAYPLAAGALAFTLWSCKKRSRAPLACLLFFSPCSFPVWASSISTRSSILSSRIIFSTLPASVRFAWHLPEPASCLIRQGQPGALHGRPANALRIDSDYPRSFDRTTEPDVCR